jgi:hypothetical protein
MRISLYFFQSHTQGYSALLGIQDLSFGGGKSLIKAVLWIWIWIRKDPELLPDPDL